MTEFIVISLVPVLAGVAAGYARGGRLLALAGRLRALWLLWLATAVQAAQLTVESLRATIEDDLGIPMLAIVFALAGLWLLVNLRGWSPAMRLAAAVVAAGALLNAVPIAANGRMPYAPAAAERAGLTTPVSTPKNVPAGDATRLDLLGDVLAVRPLHEVFSVGDVVIALGTAAMVAAAMSVHPRNNQETS